MGVNFGGLNIGMPHEFLNYPNINPVFEHMSCELMAKRMAAYAFRYSGTIHCYLDGFL